MFLNYRREDTAPYAGRLYDRLVAHFGRDKVFIDIDQIQPGEDFVEAIHAKVEACDAAIVLIGRHWLEARDRAGRRRLDNPEDFVRIEIVAALDRKIRVIPVLVSGAQMPLENDLPEPLAPLLRRNAIELSETRFHSDVDRLIRGLNKNPASRKSWRIFSAVAAATAILLAATISVMAFLHQKALKHKTGAPETVEMTRSPDSWMPSAEYQRAFEAEMAKGFRPFRVEGRLKDGREEFRAEWQPDSPPCAWEARHGLNEDAFKKCDAEYTTRGYQIMSQSSFRNQWGAIKHQALWTQGCDTTK